ncbi:MAG: DNA primase [Acidobacteria bacterium]|nr:DNA primase [Acidobacteriota bacterium]
MRYGRELVDQVRHAADIVAVIQEYVPLKKAGTTYKGLCPFHGERTPSFTVNRDKGFFHCFGCGQGGDVFKFVELQEGVGFQDAVKRVAARFGITLPEAPTSPEAQAEEAEREALLKAHELARAFYAAQLETPAGAAARDLLQRRDVGQEAVATFGIGYAPPSRDALVRHLRQQGFAPAQLVRGGLAFQRDDGSVVDRFRNRLLFPIHREGGSVVAFGGRAMADDQVPKYLNSPETPLYTKGRVLYGLHLSKHAIRKAGRVVMMEGYFDVIQAWQGGVTNSVASSGTALTQAQAQTLRRFASQVVLSFDADGAGQNAAVKSGDLLVAEGFQVGVALLPEGEDPDTYVRRAGGDAYRARVEEARPYLDFVLDRAVSRHDVKDPNGRMAFLNEMLAVAARIPEALARDQFADRLAHRAQVGEDTVRQEIRKAAVTRQEQLPDSARRASMPGVTRAERELIVGVLNTPGEAMLAMDALEDADLEPLRTGRLLRLVLTTDVQDPAQMPARILAGLTEEERRWVTGLRMSAGVVATPQECVRAIRVLRLERERGDVQREIDRLQDTGGAASTARIMELWTRKKELLAQIESLA